MSAPRRSYMTFVAKYCLSYPGTHLIWNCKTKTKTSYLSLGFTYLCLNPEPGCFASDMEDIWLDLKLDFVASYLERNFIAFGPELVLPLNIF